MQQPPQENKLAGYIAILGLVTIFIGLVVLVLLSTIRIAAWMILALGLALLIIAFVLDFRKVSKAIAGKRGRFSTGTTVMVSIFVGITLLVNAISIGSFHRFDLTGVSQFTLTSQTKDVLEQMEEPVKVICFFTPSDTYGIVAYAQTLLDEYQNHIPKQFSQGFYPD